LREADDITELHTYYPHITMYAGQSQESTSSPVGPFPALLMPGIHTHTLHVRMSCLTLVVIAFTGWWIVLTLTL